jgi:hypothetical protein
MSLNYAPWKSALIRQMAITGLAKTGLDAKPAVPVLV